MRIQELRFCRRGLPKLEPSRWPDRPSSRQGAGTRPGGPLWGGCENFLWIESLNLSPEKRKGEPEGSRGSKIVLESISRDERGCRKNDGVVRRVRQKWRGRRIRLDPQPGVDDAHHED